MAYVRGNGLGADTPAAIDPRDRAASLVQSDEHRARFAYAFRSAKYLTPAQQQALLRSLEARIDALPASRRQQVAALATTTVTLDPRASVGLGEPISGTLSTVAAIASLVATLGTLGLTTVTFLDQQKQKKAAASAERQQTSAQTALVNQQIAAQQQAMAEEKIRFDAEMAALRPVSSAPATASATKMVVGPDGRLQPATSNTTPLLLGSGVAAAAAMFFLK